jgi:hypothetical protein
VPGATGGSTPGTANTLDFQKLYDAEGIVNKLENNNK